jgi:hypothetical protein
MDAAERLDARLTAFRGTAFISSYSSNILNLTAKFVPI